MTTEFDDMTTGFNLRLLDLVTNEIMDVRSELNTVIYKHAEAEHTIIGLRADIGKLKKMESLQIKALQAKVEELEKELFLARTECDLCGRALKQGG